MEKNPVDRFQSAGEMLDDLDEFRRDPNLVFRYDLQTNNARYDASPLDGGLRHRPSGALL